MIFHPTKLRGVTIVEVEPLVDERGSLTRTFDARIFAVNGLDSRVAQCSTSFNARSGTLRGLHYQVAPHGEGKFVRCTKGRIFDVVVDLRPRSPTHMQWMGMELSAEGTSSLFVAEGCAHGFQTLEDDSVVQYQMTSEYAPECYCGVRWDDPAFAIAWPEPPEGERIMSERDRNFLDYVPSP